MFRKVVTSAVLIAPLAACSAPTWEPPPGMSPEQARIQHYECVRDGQNMIAMNTNNLFVAIGQTQDCLHAHGFTAH